MRKDYLLALANLFTQSAQNLANVEGIRQGIPSRNKSLKRVTTLFEKMGEELKKEEDLTEEKLSNINFHYDPARLMRNEETKPLGEKGQEILTGMKRGFTHFGSSYSEDAVVTKAAKFAIDCIDSLIDDTFAEKQGSILDALKATAFAEI